MASIVEGVVLGAFYPVLATLIDPFIVAAVYFMFTGATIFGLVNSFALDIGLTPFFNGSLP
jgi:fatty-acid desaturase